MERPDLIYFVFQTKTVFMPFRFLYAECFALIEGQENLHPLRCLRDSCRVDVGCMEIVAKRVNYWFTYLEPASTLLVAYFKYPDRPNSIRGGIFTRELGEPRLSALNKSAFEKFRRESVTKSWQPSTEYLGIHRDPTLIVPVTSLVHKWDTSQVNQ